MKLYIWFFCFMGFSISNFAQILRPGEEPPKEETEKKEEKKEKSKPKTTVIDGVEYELVEKKKTNKEKDTSKQAFQMEDQLFYLNLAPSHVFRVYETGNYLTSRDDEFPSFKLSYAVGMRNKIGKYMIMDLGFSYFVNGENYLFEDENTDSTFYMTRNHNTISIPLKIGMQFELEDLRLFFNAGFAPSILVNQVEKYQYQSPSGEITNDRFVKKNNLNTFNFMVMAAVGAHYKFSPNWGAQIMPEFRYNLLPSDVNQSFVHNAWAVGFHIGLTFGM